MVAKDNRVEKVKKIFYQFDKNKDGGLNTEEMSSLVVSVNPRVRFSDEQINAILEEVFKTYHDFIDIDKGLTFEGLLRTYDDGAGDVDRDFEALELELDSDSIFKPAHAVASSSSSVTDDRVAELPKKQQNWALSPSYEIVFASTWKIVEDLEILIKRLKGKQLKDGRLIVKGDDFDTFSEPGWSKEFRPSSESPEKWVIWDESGADYSAFLKQLGVLRGRVNEAKSSEEMFDGHMGMGRVLYEHHLFREGLVSFKKSCELQPMNFRPHFRAGNCLYVLRKYGEAKVEFMLALEAAKLDGNHSSYLLPQIYVNLGISLEGEGMVLSACEHYREAAILCPTHFRAVKHLGSALFGVGEYKAAEKALEEAIFLKSDYADAHCDLGSTLHAMGEGDRAIQEFQKAIDLKPGHVDALYNLGGLYMDNGRYQRASEMYTRVLAARRDHWRAQVNKAVALLGANEPKEAKRALKEAFKMTNRVELHDAIAHMKHKQKKPAKGDRVLVEPSKFKRASEDTASREDLANALDIRAFQRLTRLGFCDVDLLKKEISETKVPVSYSLYSSPGKSVRKSSLEVILRRLLHFLKPETFQVAIKAINRRILSILDYWDSSNVDLGMFFAVLAPICSGSLDKRTRVVFDALLWRHADEGSAVIRKVDAVRYIKFLRAIYLSPLKIKEMVEVHDQEVDGSTVSFSEFLEMFDNPESGFGIMDALVKLESGDRVRHWHFSCSVCRYPISGSCFKEMKSHFNLCSQCYSEGKVPSAYKQDTYSFKEYESEADVIRDKCVLLKLHSRSCTRRDP